MLSPSRRFGEADWRGAAAHNVKRLLGVPGVPATLAGPAQLTAAPARRMVGDDLVGVPQVIQ